MGLDTASLYFGTGVWYWHRPAVSLQGLSGETGIDSCSESSLWSNLAISLIRLGDATFSSSTAKLFYALANDCAEAGINMRFISNHLLGKCY